MKAPELSKALKGKFEMVGYAPGNFRFKGKEYDTTKMNVVQARAAIKAGVKFLKEIEPSTNSTTTSKK